MNDWCNSLVGSACLDASTEALLKLLRGSRVLPEVEDQTSALVPSIIETAEMYRVLGPTVWALADAGFSLPDSTRDHVASRFNAVMAWCLELEVRLLEINHWFADAGGIQFLVLKGAAVAHLDEVDPSLRSFADVDLLIAESDIDRAIAVLQDHGAVRRIPEHHRGFDRRFSKGVGLTCADGIEIDVHRTLCMGTLGFRIPLDELFARPDRFEIGGEHFRALRLEHRALHAAYHAVVGSSQPPLHTVRDLAGYLGRPELTPDALVPIASTWGGATILWKAINSTIELLDPHVPRWRGWVDEFTPDRRDLELISRSHVESRWPIESSMLRELAWRDRVAYTWGVAFPSNEALSDRGTSMWGRLRDGVRNLVDTR